MTENYRKGQRAERARTAKWLADRAAVCDYLAARQRAIGEPTAAINAASARAYRSALSFVEAGEEDKQPTAGAAG